MSCNFMSWNFMPCNFDGPSLARPSFSAPPSPLSGAWNTFFQHLRTIVLSVSKDAIGVYRNVVFSFYLFQQYYLPTWNVIAVTTFVSYLQQSSTARSNRRLRAPLLSTCPTRSCHVTRTWRHRRLVKSGRSPATGWASAEAGRCPERREDDVQDESVRLLRMSLGVAGLRAKTSL